MKIVNLFIIFLKIGSFSIGGGYAMLSFIQREIIEVNRYLNIKEFSDVLAISEMTPGPIAINSATFVGYKIAGVLGSISATLGILLPSFIMIIAITKFFSRFYNKKEVQAAFLAIRPVVFGLLIATAYFVTKSNLVDLKSGAIFAIAFFIMYKKILSPIGVLILSALIGVILF